MAGKHFNLAKILLNVKSLTLKKCMKYVPN